MIETALHALTQTGVGAPIIGLGALRVPPLMGSGEVADLAACILHDARGQAVLGAGGTVGVGSERPLGVGDTVTLAVVLDRGRAPPPALVAPGRLGARASARARSALKRARSS